MVKRGGRFHYNKILVRITIILSVLLVIILLLQYLVNYNYRDKAISVLKNYLDKELTTQVKVRKNDIRFNFFRHFPKVGIEFNNVLIKSAPGPDYRQFNLKCEDTLIFAKKISFVANAKSFITNKYEINRIEISNAKLNLFTDKKGRTNYKIIRGNSDTTAGDTLTIDLNKIQLKKVRTLYIDKRINMVLYGNIREALLSGSFTDLDFRIVSKGNITNTWLTIDHVNYLKKQAAELSLSIKKKNNIYNFRNGLFNLSGLEMKVNGYWDDTRNYYHLSFGSNSAQLERIKQPAVTRYLGKTGLVPTKGDLWIRAKIEGYSGFIPYVNVYFTARNAGFRNEQKNINITDLYAKGSFTNGPKRSTSTSVLQLDSLSARTNGSHFSTSLRASNFNRLKLDGHFNGAIELSDLKLIKSLDQRLELKGMLNTVISFKGTIPSTKHFKISDLNDLNLDGNLNFTNVKIHSLINKFPKATVSGNIDFNTFRSIYLNNVLLKVGNSSLTVNGQVSNLPLFSTKSTSFPIYRISVKSPELHVEDFLIKTGKSDKTNKFKVLMPDSLVIYSGIDFKKFYFGKFEASNVKGELSYVPKNLSISDFSMQTLQGTINSQVSVSQEDGQLISRCDASLNHLNMDQMFASFNNFGQHVISSQNLHGFLSGTANVLSAWDLHLKPLLDKLIVSSSIKINDGELINYKPMLGLSRFIAVDELKDIHFAELDCNIMIKNKTVYFSQTDIHSSAIDLSGSGEHHFDNSYDYHFQVGLSDVLWKKARKKKPENTEFGYIVNDDAGKITIPLEVKGKGSNFTVYHDKRTARNRMKRGLREQKRELKELFHSSGNDHKKVDSTEHLPKFEWEDQTDTLKHKKREIRKERKKEGKSDFKIKWND